MVATCSICGKNLVEATQVGNEIVSEDKQFLHLSERMAKHVMKKHPQEAGEIQELVAKYTAFTIMQVFDTEDAFFARNREELRVLIAEEVQADIDPFQLGATAACYYIEAMIQESPIDDWNGDLNIWKERLMEEFEITEEEIEEYGRSLKERNRDEDEDEEEKEEIEDAKEG